MTLAAYLTLFGWSFLAATILPLGSEPALALMIVRDYPAASVIFVATVGNYLGACTTYWLGRRAAQALAPYTVPDREPRAAALIRRYGQPLMLLSWVPIAGDALVAAAGAARMPFWPFSFWVVLGKAARYALIAWGASLVAIPP